MPIPSKVPESEALNTMFEALAVAASFPLPSFCACPGQPKSVGLGTAAEAPEFAMSKTTCCIYGFSRTVASQPLIVTSDSVLLSTAAMSDFGEERSCAASLS